jgi:hypothetical protein
MSEEKALAPQAPMSVAASTFAPMEGFDKTDVRGKENIRVEELQLPFLSLAQKTSAAIDKTEDTYIDGLEFGDMYNSATQEIYRRGPLNFLVVRGPMRRAYIPDANGRMGDEIAWDDPRCEWPDEKAKKAWTGKGKPKPEGVRVLDYVCLLLQENGTVEPVTISFKSKSFKAGNMLQTFIGMVQGPVFAGRFAIKAVSDENDAGKFYLFVVLPAGKPTPEQAQIAAAFYESIKDKKIAVKDDGLADEPATEGTDGAPATKSNDNIPF